MLIIVIGAEDRRERQRAPTLNYVGRIVELCTRQHSGMENAAWSG